MMMLSSLILFGENPLDNEWHYILKENGKKALIYRTTISNPKESGHATLSIEKGLGSNAGTVLEVLIESPDKVRDFPFDAFEGPVDKSKNDYLAISVVKKKYKHKISCIPNGRYIVNNNGGFVFSTINPKIISFLKKVEGGSKLLVQIHSSKGARIEIRCTTDGLKTEMKKLNQ
jgi:hypothetical protein